MKVKSRIFIFVGLSINVILSCYFKVVERRMIANHISNKLLLFIHDKRNLTLSVNIFSP